MDTIFSTTRKLKRMFANILSIAVILAMAFPTTAFAQESTARIVASEAGDWFWTTNFQAGTLYLFIYESGEEGASLLWSGNKEADQSGFLIAGYEDHGQDLVPGNYLVVSDGVTEKGLVLESITMNLFDPENEIIAGTAPVRREVLVVAGMAEAETQASIKLVARPKSGAWKADFGKLDFDITVDMHPWSFAQIFDEDGDANEAGAPPLTNPRFTVFPEWEWFDGWDWPDGAAVTIAVKGKPECKISKQSWGYFFNGGFPEGCDVVIGDTVTFRDQHTVRTHTVENLGISIVDKVANTVAGTADVGTLVYAWVHGFGGTELQLTVEDGTWLADFGSHGFDLMENMGGRAEIRDEMGNATAVDWWIPNPRFVVFPEWEWFDGIDWPDGVPVTITVAGKDECATEGASSGNFFNGGFPEGCDIAFGDTITFTDGVTTRTHTVENLAVTGVDPQAETVSGTADAGKQVHVWAHEHGEYEAQPTAGDGGDWTANFTEVGFDLQAGMRGRAEIRDTEGNATAVDWYISNPRIIASITENWFYLVEFAPNALLDLDVYESQGGPLVWEGTATTDGSGHTWVDAEERWDLEPGYYLVAADGTSTKDLAVEGFAFDLFDSTQGLLKGTAPEPFGRRVWVGIGWENDGWSMDVTTNNKGAWTADFGAPVPNRYGWVAAQIFDVDGDASELRPAQIIDRTLTAGNFYVEWSTTNPEEVVELRWKDSVDLTNTWAHPSCPDDLEFFGNSWSSESEGDDLFFFASLVGWGTTGSWKEQPSTKIKITSKSSGCPGSADIPIKTDYRFFNDELRANLMVVQRTIKFGDIAYAHDVRPFIPRLYPSDGFTEVLHPNATGDELITAITCDFGCVAESWNGSWFAIHNPSTGLGMIVQRKPSLYSAALWLDDDDGSFTNSSSMLLLHPEGGFTGTVTETEYLCFYDSNIWTPSLNLPPGCQP